MKEKLYPIAKHTKVTHNNRRQEFPCLLLATLSLPNYTSQPSFLWLNFDFRFTKLPYNSENLAKHSLLFS